MFKQNLKPTLFVLDIDGVLSTGQFLYSRFGKIYKIFGAHDSEGLKLISQHLKIQFISADKRGFGISKRRVKDLGFSLSYVDEKNRLDFFNNIKNENIVFMGDSYTDSFIFEYIFYSITPSNAVSYAKDKSNFITESKAGEGAVFEACMHLIEKFFNE